MGKRGNYTRLPTTNQIVADADLKSFAASASLSSSSSTLLSVAFPGHVSRALLIVPSILYKSRGYMFYSMREFFLT